MGAEPPIEDSIILCGGLGSRLEPVLNAQPKALAPVCGRPFLEWLILALRRAGVRRTVLAGGHFGEQIRQHFRGNTFGVEILHSTETEPLDTGGALHLAAAMTTAPALLVLNGDSYCPFDLARMAAFHRYRRASATIWLAPALSGERFGNVEIDGDGRVVAFREKSVGSAGLVSAGIYLIERRVVDGIEGRSSLEREVFPSLVRKGLFGLAGSSSLVDIGTPESLADADRALGAELDELERLA